jgi:Na+/melibiose symporter-like transporter
VNLGVIRRTIFAFFGIVLTSAGFGCFAYWLSAEPGFGPQSTDMAFAYVVAGMALGAFGIWLLLFSVRHQD